MPEKLAEHRAHIAKVGRNMAAHILPPWLQRAFSNLKRWFLGTQHGAMIARFRRTQSLILHFLYHLS